MLIKKIENGVLRLTLDRPEIHNAFNDKLIELITKEFLHVAKNDDIRMVVLTGSGRSFCAGADLNWMKSMIGYSEEENIEDSRKLFQMFESINDCQKPVLGLINGHALGGGMGLLSVCDYVLTHDKAKFGFTETRLGLIPAVISSFCIRKIGESHARAWFLSGEKFLGPQAKDMGIVHEVCAVDEFEKRGEELVHSFMQAAPEATMAAKDLIFNVLESDEIEEFTCRAIAQKRISNEGQEGMTALLEKRKAKWVEEL